MSDQLKQFIDENREAFDTNEPDPQLFKRIQEQVKAINPAKKTFPRIFRFAAAAVLLVAVSITIYMLANKKDTNKTVADNKEPVFEEAVINAEPAYAKQINHFREMIGLQQSALKQLEKEYPKLYKQFVGDITELDSSYQSLKTNLSNNPNREMLLEAMIQNLQLQSELLNKQLLIIKEIKQKSKPNNVSNKNNQAA